MPSATIDRVTAAVSDPPRRAILDRLTAGPARAGELAEPFAISQPAVSRHLLRELARWTATYERFWTGKLDRLERHFSTMKESP